MIFWTTGATAEHTIEDKTLTGRLQGQSPRGLGPLTIFSTSSLSFGKVGSKQPMHWRRLRYYSPFPPFPLLSVRRGKGERKPGTAQQL
jgi:hypothetical protein